MIDYQEFQATAKLADPDVTLEWGTKWLYLVPAEVTRDKWEIYVEVCRAYDLPAMPPEPYTGFYVQTLCECIHNRPWRKGVEPAHKHSRKPLSKHLKSLMEDVGKLREWRALTSAARAGMSMTRNKAHRIEVLRWDPFIIKYGGP